jgi:hypothetical protein
LSGVAAGRCHFGHPVKASTDPRLLSPKANRFPEVVADKRRRVHDRHVAPLNRVVEQINAKRNEHLAPWFDPGGAASAPACCSCSRIPAAGPRPRAGSGFISTERPVQRDAERRVAGRLEA